MTQLPDLKARIRIDTTQLQTSMAQAEQSTSRAGSMMRTGLGVAAVAVGGALVTMGGLAAKTGIQTAAAMQSAQIGFTTLLGSGEKAKAFLADLSSFAAKTPYELPGLINASRQLIGVGRSAEETIPILTAFGNATSALSIPQEGFQRIMLATTQAMAKGKIQGEEMMQMMENGLPVLGLLSRATGKTEAEISKLATQGKLLSAEVFPQLYAQMNKEYGGAMEAQSKTLNGAWSTLKDTVQQSLGAAFQPLIPMLSTALPQAAALFQKAVDGVSGALRSLPETARAAATSSSDMGDAFTRARDNLQSLKDLVGKVMDDIKKWVADNQKTWDQWEKKIGSIMKSTQEIVASVTAVMAALWDLNGHAMFGAVKMVFTGIFNIIDGTMSAINNIFKFWIAIFNGDWTGAWEAFKGIWAGAAQAVLGIFQALLGGILATWTALAQALLAAVGGFFASWFSFWLSSWQAVWEYLRAIWNAIYAAVQGQLDKILDKVKVVMNGIYDAIRNIGQIVGIVSAAFQGAYNAASAKLGSLVEIVKGIPSKIYNALSGLYTQMYSIGENIVQGIANGVMGALRKVLDAVKNMAKEIKEAASSVLGIFSPSRVFRYYGHMIGEGLSLGIMDEIANVVDATHRLTSASAQAGMATTSGTNTSTSTTWAPQIQSINGASASEIVDEIDWRSGFGGSRG